MYLIRRILKTQPGKAWEVAGYLSKVTEAYERGGRNKAQIFVGGQGLPGEQNIVYAEWTQATIEQTDRQTIPEDVFKISAKMNPLLTEYTIEFFDLVSPEKLKARGLA